MREPSYPAARSIAARVRDHFITHLEAAHSRGSRSTATVPSVEEIETIVDVAFWASLRREEGYSPKISLAYLQPDSIESAMRFSRRLPFTPPVLTGLAPAVERPGIHLGVAREGEELGLWGATRTIPPFCFVLEVVGPGLLVIKHRRQEESGKFVNVVALEGDHVKFIDDRKGKGDECPSIVTTLLGLEPTSPADGDVDVLVELATSMRAHGRGGILLVVPDRSSEWLESLVQPISYSVSPPFSSLRKLLSQERTEHQSEQRWLDAVGRTIEGIAGLTAVDGATVISREYDLLAFGAKIAPRKGSERVERVLVTEPILGTENTIVHPSQLGGTRHLAAVQFAHDQRDAVALVASQDGRFTVFTWSKCEDAVVAYRAEALLL